MMDDTAYLVEALAVSIESYRYAQRSLEYHIILASGFRIPACEGSPGGYK